MLPCYDRETTKCERAMYDKDFYCHNYFVFYKCPPATKWIGGRELTSWQFGGGWKLYKLTPSALRALVTVSLAAVYRLSPTSTARSRVSTSWFPYHSRGRLFATADFYFATPQVWLKACTMNNRGRAVMAKMVICRM
jgi:hypothetical protein